MFYNGINLPIARVLWGNHADTVLFRAYEEFSAEYISERAEGLPYSPIAATLLQQSWLSNLVHEWIYDKDAVYHDQSRELVFNLEMTGGLN